MISVVIIASNSQRTIERCLNAIKEFEVILYLNNSSDDTKNIAQKFNNVKIIDGYFDGFGPTKNRAIKYATNDWILFLDSDEVLTDKLRDELKSCDFKYNAYYISRLNNYFGRWHYHGGLFPDYHIRFFNKNFANYKDFQVHESVDFKGDVGYMKNYFLHYCCDTVEEFIYKQNLYSTLNGKKDVARALLAPFWRFFKMYILHRGFLDGWSGYVVAKLYSQYVFWKYIK